MRSTVCITTAPPRTGKTYMRGAVFVAKEFLPFSQGLHISNMPLRPEAFAEYCRRHYRNEYDAMRRIVRIPDDLLRAWREEEGTAGPWDVMGPGKLWELAGSHIAIDEAHLFIPSAGQLDKRRLWRNWLREIGHQGATVEFITQNLEGLDKQVQALAEVRYSITTRVSDRDPLFRIPMADWYELKGALSGEWAPVIQQFERRRVDRGWQALDTKMAELRPEFYALYESYSKPQADGEGDTDEAVFVPEHEFQRRSFFGLLVWFFRRNGWRFGFAAVCVGLFGWLTFGGGFNVLVLLLMSYIQAAAGGPAADAATVEEKGAEVVESAPLDSGASAAGVPAGGADGLVLPLDSVIYQGPEGVYRVEDLAELMEDRAFLEVQAAEQERELELYRRDLSAVVMIGPDVVVFSSGERVRVGEAIRESGYENVGVLAVNFPRREVHLTDGRVLRVRLPEGQKRSGVFSGLSSGVGVGVAGGGGGGGGVGAGSARDSVGGGRSHGPVSSGAESSMSRFSDLGGSAGYESRDGGVSGGAVGGGVGVRGAEGGGPGDGGGGSVLPGDGAPGGSGIPGGQGGHDGAGNTYGGSGNTAGHLGAGSRNGGRVGDSFGQDRPTAQGGGFIGAVGGVSGERVDGPDSAGRGRFGEGGELGH